ncbi:MAG: hypothetical protein KGI37_01990 [Alphaproteobacteria bacterium]|nr:hypothetical protein [Alphaproteobacteria bacterium]
MSLGAFFVALSVLASLIRYTTYCLSIYHGRTRPHVFSWFNWGVAIGIGAYAQFKLGAGVSVWGYVLVATTCLGISGWALISGEKNITRSDWATFIGALAAIVLWRMTKDPMNAIWVLMAIDVLTYWPTVRKSWHDPWGEPPGSYFWSGLRYFFLLFAVPEPTFSTLVYPVWLMLTDWVFIIYILWRRRMLAEKGRAIA